ncbi:hypothetical protein JXVLWARM_CDS_0002 [Burkholderia phage Bm1]
MRSMTAEILSIANQVAAHRAADWRTLDPAILSFCAIHAQNSFNKLKTAYVLNLTIDEVERKLDNVFVRACVADAMAIMESERVSTTTAASLEQEFWNVYRIAMGQEESYVVDKFGNVKAVQLTDLKAANTALTQLKSLAVHAGGSAASDGVDPIEEAWTNYKEAKGKRDDKAAQYWFGLWAKLKGLVPDDEDTDTEFAWEKAAREGKHQTEEDKA